MRRIVVLVSGNGSNLQSLIDHSASGDLDAQVVGVVSNNPNAYALQRATEAAIPTGIIDASEVIGDGGNRDAFDIELAALVATYEPDLVVLAGWMLILGADFLDRFPDKVINLHPAMPGAFPGTKAIERAHTAFQRGEIKRTGVMVHKVVPEVDAGPVVTMEPVPIFEGETVADLEQRVKEVEHNLIVAAVALLLGDT